MPLRIRPLSSPGSSILAAMLLAGSLAGPGPARAQIHLGSTDPLTEGFTTEPGDGTAGVSPIGSDPDFPDVAAWQVENTGARNRYRLDGPAPGASWTLSARMRVVRLADVVDANIVLEVADGANRWFVSFGSNASGGTLMTFSGGGTFTRPPSQPGRTDYFLIEIAGDGTTADVFVDGVEVASDWTGVASTLQRVHFGDGQTSSSGRGRYQYVKFAPGPQACRDGDDDDGDGSSDAVGGDAGCSQPNDPSEDDVDRDGDGLADLVEIRAGTALDDPDSDDDGLTDGVEVGTGDLGEEQVITSLANGAASALASDLDGDGDLDVVSAATFDDEVAWYENTDGRGSFGPRQIISNLVNGVLSVVASDLDGDGDMDLLASPSGSEVVWLENSDGAGSFAPPQVVTNLTNDARSVFAVDVDGDGDADVLSASRLNDEIAWYENTDGAGSFGPQQIITNLADSPRSVFGADLDGDGDVDVLSASFIDDEIAWYENTDGAGSFGPQQVITNLADGAISVFAADVDGDGDRDVLSASETDDEVAWYENTDGAGHFGPQQLITNLADVAASVFAADLDGDGDADVVSSASPTSPLGARVAWYENTDGAGSFGPQELISRRLRAPGLVFVADVDGDGDGDVLSTSRLDDQVVWFENRNVGDPLDADSDDDGLPDGLEYDLLGTDPLDADSDDDGLSDGEEFDLYATDPLAADSDGDGLLDGYELANGFPPLDADANANARLDGGDDADGDGLGNAYEQAFGTGPNDPDSDDDGLLDGEELASGSFGAQQVITTLADQAASVVAADVDGDGDVDALSASFTDDKIAWYANTDGAGTFGPQQLISTAARTPSGVFAADMDGDGDLDALSASQSDGKIAWYENTDGTGLFGFQRVITTLAPFALSVLAADVDGDRDLDVLAASGGPQITWYENTDGIGTFGPQRPITTPATGVRSIFAADVDGDGDVDVLSASEPEDEIAWFENTDGAGTFGPRQVISALADGARSVFAADVDGDGDLDALSASTVDSKIAWYENTDGTGSFGPQQVISTLAASPWSVHAADVDADGDMDVLSASAGDDEIAWYENTDGYGTFAPQQIITSLTNLANSVTAADVDGDGDLDVLSSSLLDDKIAWYENLNVSDPLDPDSDDDGRLDGDEIAFGSDPLDPFSFEVAIDVALIASPANAPDTTGFGAVASVYAIAPHEVTNEQYAAFLNAVADDDPNGLFHATPDPLYFILRTGEPGSHHYTVTPGREVWPVGFVSYYDGLRFANWLHNGQPTGAQGPATTEDGAYTITAGGVATNSIVRNVGARHSLPTEDEWYKSAYYDSVTEGYYDSPSAAASPIVCLAPSATANSANCGNVLASPTVVGSYTTSSSPNATYDQGGNVAEWTESIEGTNRRVRGGSYSSPAIGLEAAGSGAARDPLSESADLGIRLVPEPGSTLGLWLGAGALFGMRRCRRACRR